MEENNSHHNIENSETENIQKRLAIQIGLARLQCDLISVQQELDNSINKKFDIKNKTLNELNHQYSKLAKKYEELNLRDPSEVKLEIQQIEVEMEEIQREINEIIWNKKTDRMD